MRADRYGIGPGHIPFLTAIGEGRVTHNGRIIGSCYYLDGEPIGTWQVRSLVRRALVETRDGAARLTPDGERALADWESRYITSNRAPLASSRGEATGPGLTRRHVRTASA
jgi:hypothetical protein